MLKRVLDIGTSVATILAAAAIVWAVFFDEGSRHAWPWRSRVERSPAGYVAGDKIERVAGLDFHSSERTLLIVFRSRCRYCIESAPYYQQLVSLRNKKNAPVRIVGIAFEQDPEARSFISDQGWSPDQLVLVPPSTIKVKAAPSVILVDSDATVVATWLGRTSAASYRDIATTAFGEGS